MELQDGKYLLSWKMTERIYIKTKEFGMFWEFFPACSGTWKEDRKLFAVEEEGI